MNTILGYPGLSTTRTALTWRSWTSALGTPPPCPNWSAHRESSRPKGSATRRWGTPCPSSWSCLRRTRWGCHRVELRNLFPNIKVCLVDLLAILISQWVLAPPCRSKSFTTSCGCSTALWLLTAHPATISWSRTSNRQNILATIVPVPPPGWRRVDLWGVATEWRDRMGLQIFAGSNGGQSGRGTWFGTLGREMCLVLPFRWLIEGGWQDVGVQAFFYSR